MIKKTLGFFLGSPVGYFGGSFFAGSQTDQSGLFDPFIFDFGNWQLHLHHWLISIIFLVFFYLFLRKKYNLPTIFLYFSVGILSGLVVQGIFSYSDWYRVLIKIN